MIIFRSNSYLRLEFFLYENDTEFSDLLAHPNEYIEILKHYQGFISPDCFVYRDMPLAVQITNIYRNRAIGYCMQKHGVYRAVYPPEIMPMFWKEKWRNIFGEKFPK